MTQVIQFADAQRLRTYKNMSGLEGADLEEHKRIFPDFAEWLAQQSNRVDYQRGAGPITAPAQ